MNQKRIIFSNSICTGCRACEVACSFHHERVFASAHSSIFVDREEEKGLFELRIIREGRYACDMCEGEEMPFCIKYCAPKALSVEEAK